MGDVVITLPYLDALRRQFPEARLDLLTRREVAEIPRRSGIFHAVHAIGGGRNRRLMQLSAAIRLPGLIATRYDIVADLQNDGISGRIRRALGPAAWCAFDRHSPSPAGTRTKDTLEQLNLGPLEPAFDIGPLSDDKSTDTLRAHGWTGTESLVVLNPAGFFPSRNWPLENYIELARSWMTTVDPRCLFVLLGIERIADKARALSRALGDRCINLVGKTSPGDAFAIVARANLVISEDSGLMHMAWVNGVPTVALFGSSRSDWSRPLGEHSVCLHSGDLPCGCCLLETCKFGDTRCLTRYSPGQVLETAVSLLQKLGRLP
jgi:ADP-heptose:LPS heptosyltransferase